ncbi:hypothetical protein QQZ08_006081 [Neonectria magnoliae]|uniref:Uncharacterized protein n=1 Tax=Neonectria magnoliae TaxID=2732573 RepID=A0ABR1I3A3_9HYPO
MGKTRDPQRESVRAANYAQAQQCFHDYKGPPYRFHDQIADLQKTVHQADSDGLVPQPGLRAIRLSFSEINLDVDAPEEGLRSFSSPPISPLVSFNDLAAFRVLRELRISPEPLDVEHNIKKELQQYLDGIRSEQSCNILNEWLPLSPVDIDRDEGLEFSSASSRWQKLALRELERETIAISEGARQLVRNAEDMNLDRNAGWLKGDDLGLQVSLSRASFTSSLPDI